MPREKGKDIHDAYSANRLALVKVGVEKTRTGKCRILSQGFRFDGILKNSAQKWSLSTSKKSQK